MGQVAITIAGISVRLCVGQGVAWVYPPTHKEFLNTGGPSDCIVQVDLLNSELDGCRRPCDGRKWCFRDSGSAGNETLSVWKCSEDGGLERTLEHHLDAPVARVRVRPGKTCGSYPLTEPFEQLLWMNLLASRDGFIVHACSAIIRGKAFLFPGGSGCGKSSMASLLDRYSEAMILSDELTIIRRVQRELCAFGTPWPSSAGCVSPLGAPLRAVLFLEHGYRNSLSELSDGVAMAGLYGCMCRPVWLDLAGRQGFLGSIRLPRRVNAARFSFLPDPSAVDYLKTKFGW